MEHKPGTFRTSIGGQALIEGILMRGPEKQAIVVRSPEGLVTKVEELTLIKDKYPILGLPILRGAVTFLDSMIRGVKALMFSADYFPDDEAAQTSKLDLWLEKHVPAEKLQNVLVWVSVLLSLGMTLVLFMLLPTFVAGLFRAQNAALHISSRASSRWPSFWPIWSSAPSRRMCAGYSATTVPNTRPFSAMSGPAPDGGKRPHPAQASSPLRHQLPLCGHHRVHPVQQCRFQLRQLAEHLGPYRDASAAADPGGGHHL